MPRRLLLFFTPHGTIYDQWKPGGADTAFTLSPILQPLAAHRSKLVVIDGLRINGSYHPNCALAPHPIGMATLWTGCRVNDIETVVPGGNVPVGVWSTGPSIDQVIASRLNAGTRFRSLEVGVQTSISQAAFRTVYSAARTTVNPQTDPRALYASLFSGINADAARLERLRFEKQSMIDVNRAEVDALMRRAGAHDRAKLEAHLTALRDLERQLAQNTTVGCQGPAMPMALDAGAVANRPELFDQQASLVAAAFACDLTRVASSCSALGTCVCSPETDAQLCARAGRTCGALTVTDSCGQLRSISSCGTCTSGSSCSTQGRCVCTPETDAQLCARLGWACGPLTATDTCGASRVVSSCGSCAPGNACSGGVCACASETDASFCARRSAACGSVSGVDGCGNPRSVATCGSCSGHQTCGGGGLSNQCGCTAESDAALCARLSKDCGSLTAMDTCGLTRTVPSCGTCSGPQTCGGGGTPNVCACLAETDAQFCARHGNSCGSVTATDTCGATRTVASCSTCPGAPNGTPACVNGSCTVACNTGYQACATGCCPRVTETIDVSTSWFRSGGFAVQPDGTAHVIYWRQQPSTGLGEVRYGRKVNGVWALTTLRTGATSADPGGIAVEPGGRVHLVSGSQYWVSATGGGFAPPESFDASPASLPVMALSQSTVHVAYRAAAQVGGTWRSEVRYTERSATGWSQPMVLGTDISVDDRINVAVAASGDVLVSFRASNAVQVAVRSGGSWNTQSLAANTGNYSTVVAQPRPGGGAWVSYHVGYGSTRVAESTTGPYATAFSFGGWARLADGATPEPILAGVTYVNLNTPGNLVLVRRINGAWQSETILANVADGTMAGDAFVDANGRVYVLAEGYQSLRLFY